MSMAKIKARHLERHAVIYVRQSSPKQVLGNRESTARQYALNERALELGWSEHRVRFIDADLGQRAGEDALGTREGFGSLCQLLARDLVGGVFGIEVSRLARNTVEWFQLLHLCRIHDVLLIEDSQIYAPSRDDDSLVLGIKGTFSAAETSILRARMEGGRRNKALRGALYFRASIGFVRDGDGIRKDPDQRVQAAILTVFARFREAGSARQATALIREAGEPLPFRSHPDAQVAWGPATYDRVLRILKHPAMGGSYAYGFRRGVGHGAPLRPVSEQWDILLPARHEGYVTWTEWLAVQEQLANNHVSPDGSRGAARNGKAILAGLGVCGVCGRAMSLSYNKKGYVYSCSRRDPVAEGTAGGCGSVGGKRVDAEVVRLFLETVTPAGAEAAQQAARDVAERAKLALRRFEQSVAHCRYEAGLAARRYRQVDPDNRLIASTLERDWEKALIALQEAEQELETARIEQPELPPPELFEGLGHSLSRVWQAPTTTNADRKRLLGCLVDEVALLVDRTQKRILATVHWRGGRTDEIALPLIVPPPPPPRRDDRSTVELVRHLVQFFKDQETARILNRQGRRTAHGLTFTAELVGRLRRRHDILAHVPRTDNQACELLSVVDAARELGIQDATLYRWIHAGLLPVEQTDVDGAPLRVRMTDDLRARFCASPPKGFVPVSVATRRLGVSRQTIWKRVRSGDLESCHVTYGKQKGLYIALPDDSETSPLQLPFEDSPQ